MSLSTIRLYTAIFAVIGLFMLSFLGALVVAQFFFCWAPAQSCSFGLVSSMALTRASVL